MQAEFAQRMADAPSRMVRFLRHQLKGEDPLAQGLDAGLDSPPLQSTNQSNSGLHHERAGAGCRFQEPRRGEISVLRPSDAVQDAPDQRRPCVDSAEFVQGGDGAVAIVP